jgi:hypothetical protein
METAIRDKRTNYELGKNRKVETTTNNTVPNLTTIMPAYIKLADRNPNLTAARILTMLIKLLSCEGCDSEFSHP